MEALSARHIKLKENNTLKLQEKSNTGAVKKLRNNVAFIPVAQY